MFKHNEKSTSVFWKHPGDITFWEVNDAVQASILCNGGF